MNDLISNRITCPFCGERIDILVNAEDEGDTYIEDCQVCCCPISIAVSIDEGGDVVVQVRNENET